MSLVNVSDVPASLFLLGVVFILLIFGLLSLGILRMFEKRFRVGWYSFAGAVFSSVAFGLILNQWYL
ncbi:hypothetical protein IDH44_18850 [Paenibacillus sp. IB182496]|uniref:Uncharacterized protein n=1 Tax=Paenibacillus sabuli TaxID=2772509 RepID=A0A927GT58_9BACL|nr:hypothetical protein [Paenibacillus sabuli]